jgi:hypothetical protein
VTRFFFGVVEMCQLSFVASKTGMIRKPALTSGMTRLKPPAAATRYLVVTEFGVMVM